MRSASPSADLGHVLTSPHRYDTRGHRAKRTGREAGDPLVRKTRPRDCGPYMTEMENPRMEPVNDIRERLERREYEVDASKVAAAILERLVLSGTLPTDE